jgi:hypothetical protein
MTKMTTSRGQHPPDAKRCMRHHAVAGEMGTRRGSRRSATCRLQSANIIATDTPGIISSYLLSAVTWRTRSVMWPVILWRAIDGSERRWHSRAHLVPSGSPSTRRWWERGSPAARSARGTVANSPSESAHPCASMRHDDRGQFSSCNRRSLSGSAATFAIDV